jgi:hypothetical protein
MMPCFNCGRNTDDLNEGACKECYDAIQEATGGLFCATPMSRLEARHQFGVELPRQPEAPTRDALDASLEAILDLPGQPVPEPCN